MLNMLANLVIEKDKEDAFTDSGSGTALVNILKSMSIIGYRNDDFLQVILDAVISNFKELDIQWATMLFKELGEFPPQDATPILRALIQMSHPLHSKLKKGYVK